MFYTIDKPSYGNVNERIKELKNKSKFSKVEQVLKGSKGDFLLKHLPKTICHMSY